MNIVTSFDKKNSYYLAGPMSGIPEFNYPEFERVKNELINNGIEVRSPHNIPWPEGDIRGEDLWIVTMSQATVLLVDCDAVILMNGWENSRGANREKEIATERRMPVFRLGANNTDILSL